MDDAGTLIRFIHVLFACAWIGGMLFLGFVAVPAARTLGDETTRRSVITAVAKKFGTFAVVAWAGLFLSGVGLLHERGLGLGDLPDTAYGRRILLKMLLLLFVGAIALIHGLYQGPRVRQAEAAGDAEGARRLKMIGGVLDGIMLLGSLAALWLATSLVP